MTTPVLLSVADSPPPDPASYPIGFALRDDDGQSVITITDDPAEQHAHLEITNTSGGDLLMDAPAAGAQASPDTYHFELRFRPGVLSSASLTQLRIDEQVGWSFTGPQPQPDGTVSLFLLSTAAATLTPTAPIRLRLSQISADGGNGARGTQLELRFRLRYPDGTPLADTKLLHLDLVNQRGKKYVPLHVGFVGSHTVLNDGRTPNSLTVRLTNISAGDLRLAGLSEPAPTRFIVSFDAGQTWGLASPSALAAMTIDAIDGENLDEADWDVQPGRQLGQGLAWTLTHKKADAALGPGQVVQIHLGNIVTAMPSGDTNLYVRYENIPGYWDGQFVCTIEKAPILYDAQGNVGIATATPAHRLQVGDDAAGLGIDPAAGPGQATYLRFGDNTGHALHLARSREGSGAPLNTGDSGILVSVRDGGDVGVGTDTPVARLTVTADSTATDEGRQLVIQGHTDTHNELALGYHTQRNYGSLQAVTQGLALRPLMLNPAGGGVGIGLTRDPAAALEVNGGIRSPMWQALTLFGNASGPLPQTSEAFPTGGGTLVLLASGSASRPGPGLIGLELLVDDRYVGAYFLTLTTGNQRTPLTATMIATGVPAGGAHHVTLRPFSDAPDMHTDGNDLFNVTVLELPF